MRIDTHQHFWRYQADEYGWIGDDMQVLRRDFGPADLKPLLDQVGFDGCVAVQARQSLEETRALLAHADANPFVVGVVGWMDLASEDARTQLAEWAVHPKLVGVRHVVQDEPDDRFLLGAAFGRGIALLEELDLAYDILIYPRHLPVAAEFVSRFPGQRFVLDHLAKPDIRHGRMREWARDLGRLAAYPHVCAKISGLVTEADWHAWRADDLLRYIEVAWQCFGPDRLMVGSDWPVCTVASDYARTIGVALDFLQAKPAAEQAMVLGGTAARFYRCRPGLQTRPDGDPPGLKTGPPSEGRHE
jgi:L-fuconolactonase